MKLVNLSSGQPRDKILSAIKNHDEVNRGVRFDEKTGIPRIKVKEKGDRLRITCELTGRPTKDNGFIVGTYFVGKLRSANGETTLRGVILTAPIYHLVLFAIFAAFVVMCIVKGGFSVVPIFLLAFDFVIFGLEFKKQGIISRFLLRAFRYAESPHSR